MNDFKKRMEVKLLTNTTFEQKALYDYREKEVKRYMQLYENEDIREYFHTIVAAIMLTQNNRYENFTIGIPYRFKSPYSIEKKLDEYVNNVHYDDNQDFIVNFKEMLDVFAMKITAQGRPDTLYSNNPEIQKLIEEKENNTKFLSEMQKFKCELLEDEFSSPKKYKYTCTKIQYFENCREILERIKTLIDDPKKEYKLIEHYDKQIMDINNCLNFLYAANDIDAIIEEEDLNNSKSNFFSILQDFQNRMHNKLDLTILTEQFTSLFNNNEIFDQLGISLQSIEPKKKRTSNGFEANFFYINTLFGKIECQLQTSEQYKDGNYGQSAHTKLKGKAIKPLPIPNSKDKEKTKLFIENVKRIEPQSFFARMDANEQNRVMIQQFGDYHNYKNLISQVTKGDPSERYILNYFSKLYAVKDKLFKSHEKSLGYVNYDIDNYLQSPEFNKLKKKALKTQNSKDVNR